jgi:hypothetical protein
VSAQRRRRWIVTIGGRKVSDVLFPVVTFGLGTADKRENTIDDIFADSCCISRSNSDEGVRDRGSPIIVVHTLLRLVVLFDVDKLTGHVFASSHYGADGHAGGPWSGIHVPTKDVVGASSGTCAETRERIGLCWENTIELPFQTPNRAIHIVVINEWTPMAEYIRVI